MKNKFWRNVYLELESFFQTICFFNRTLFYFFMGYNQLKDGKSLMNSYQLASFNIVRLMTNTKYKIHGDSITDMKRKSSNRSFIKTFRESIFKGIYYYIWYQHQRGKMFEKSVLYNWFKDEVFDKRKINK